MYTYLYYFELQCYDESIKISCLLFISQLITGKDIYIFNGQRFVSKKMLTDLGLPATIEHVRLVYTWNYWTEQPMYIWTKDQFWRVDKVRMIGIRSEMGTIFLCNFSYTSLNNKDYYRNLKRLKLVIHEKSQQHGTVFQSKPAQLSHIIMVILSKSALSLVPTFSSSYDLKFIIFIQLPNYGKRNCSFYHRSIEVIN